MDSSRADHERHNAVHDHLTDVASGQIGCPRVNSMAEQTADDHGTSAIEPATSRLRDVEVEEDDFFEASLFVDESYIPQNFQIGDHQITVLALKSAATDFDLTGQIVWPGAQVMNEYLVRRGEELRGKTVVELGSGVGLTGLLCSRYCQKVIMTDHNDLVLKVMQQNVELQQKSIIASQNISLAWQSLSGAAQMGCAKLEWGNKIEATTILDSLGPNGIDIVIGADVCYQQANIPPMFDTVMHLLRWGKKEKVDTGTPHKKGQKFLLAYVNRSHATGRMVLEEAERHNLRVTPVESSKKIFPGGLEGIVYEMEEK